LKKWVPKLISINIIVITPASTGITAISRKEVISQVHTNIGMSISRMPGARMLMMVATILMAPRIELMPAMCSERIKKVVDGGA